MADAKKVKMGGLRKKKGEERGKKTDKWV